MKILVVDDDAFVLGILVRQLQQLGYSELNAQDSARSAIAVLEREQEAVGLIFLDLQMPEMDGIEFVRHLVRIGYAGALVLISGEDERVVQAAERLARAHRLDVLGALCKPVSPEGLQEVLESDLLRHARKARPRRTYEAAALGRAIRCGELVNFFQPKVSLADGVVRGVEALVRWRHPTDGLVSPVDFISLAEEHGLITELTHAVLRGALEQTGIWRSQGHDLQVAINVSMDNLEDLDFPEWVLHEVQHAGLPPAAVMLEVTESRLMKDPVKPLDILTRLRLKRIGLSIDDFGTGHSSLAQLRDLPFEELKVDRSFVHGACHNAPLAAILRASISMARQLGMRSVAEGIEDRADWDYLKDSGCDVGQGYFISAPMPADEFSGWLADWRDRSVDL